MLEHTEEWQKIYRGVLSPSGYLYVSAKPHKDSVAVHELVAILAAAKRFTYAETGGFFNMSASHVKEVVSSVSRARPTENK